METIGQIIAITAVVSGTLYSVVGVLGMVRLPDVFTRIHAVGKVGVFGVVLLTVAATVSTPLGWARALVLIAFLLVTGPVSAHAMASAAYRIGLKPVGAARDDLRAPRADK